MIDRKKDSINKSQGLAYRWLTWIIFITYFCSSAEHLHVSSSQARVIDQHTNKREGYYSKMWDMFYYSKVLFHLSLYSQCCRCLCTQNVREPQDTIRPPTRLWRYVINKYMRVVDKVENKLENNVPKVFQVYKTIKGNSHLDTNNHVWFCLTKA